LILDFGKDFGLEERAVFVVDLWSGCQPIPYFWADPQHRLGLVLAQLPDLVSDLGDVLLGNGVRAFRGWGRSNLLRSASSSKYKKRRKAKSLLAK
jgi:hypothetical protein